MVYDPTAFIVCKLVVVAWLIAYGATTKPRAPVEQLPHGDAARRIGIEVVDQAPLPSYTAIPLLIQNILLGNIQVFKREIHNGLMK